MKKMIYALTGPDDRMAYIGNSKNNETYVIQHHRSAAKAGRNKSPVNEWIRETGLKEFKLEVLEYVEDEDGLAADRQQWWIDSARLAGHPVLNLTKEEISARAKEAMSDPATKAKMLANRPKSYSKREDWVSQKGKTGRTISEEHKEAVRRTHKGKTVSEETRKKISEKAKGHKRNLGHRHSEETKAKMSHTKLHTVRGIIDSQCAFCAML